MEDDFFSSFDMDFEEADLLTPDRTGLTSDEILHWSSWIRPFPLPPHLVPVTEQCLDDVDDDVLLNAPPHMIAHIHRTAAQGGLQVISPRQTPISCLMERISEPKRKLGDHVVGSIASPRLKWPTIDDDDMDRMLPDEPLAVREDELAIRKKTRTEPLTRAPHLMRDPILACLIKGRAVIDLLRRDDVMGDADALAEIIAAAWGVKASDVMDLDAFTLGIDGPLLRHAIRADDVYPMVHAPVHQKLAISVGSTEANRELLIEDSAIDWRRLRVFCEAVFLMCCSVEGYPLTDIRAVPPPGDPSAPLNRPGILAFQIAPCTAWSHEARTFSIYPTRYTPRKKLRQIPKEVLEALSTYVKHVRPMSFAMERGHRAIAKKSVARRIEDIPSETLSNAYSILARNIHTGGGRGKNSSRAVRNLIYEAVEAADLEIRLKLARYFHITKRECQIHLRTEEVPDSIIDKISGKFLRVGELIRLKVVAECARRGGKIEVWWKDITSQAPTSYALLNEGTVGWAKVAMWLLFKAPSEKWANLEKAIHYGALREAELAGMSAVSLPPVLGSHERILAAARHLVKCMSRAYSSYYSAVSDIAMCISDELNDRKKTRSAAVMKEAAYLWVLRARAMRGTNVNAISKDTPTPSQNHLRVKAAPMDLLIVPAPYRCYEAWKVHVLTDSIIHDVVKTEVRQFNQPKISNLFLGLKIAMLPAPVSLCTRYLLEPWRLGADMDKAWGLLARDTDEVVKTYCMPEVKVPRVVTQEMYINDTEDNLDLRQMVKKQKTGTKSYYDLLAEMDPDQSEWVEDFLDGMDENIALPIMEDSYSNVGELICLLMRIQSSGEATGSGNKETVV